jgi:RNA polymerase sigma-70 factor (ECF subfamily)
MSDGDLLRSREADAFAILYDRHVASVYRWARTRVGDHAADVTAEVFARAWLRRGTFRDHASGNAAPWLYGIAHNVLLDSLRKRQTDASARKRLGLPEAMAPDPELEAVENRASLPQAVLQALDDLPPDERELLRLRVVEERPYREIAAKLSCTPQAARLRFSRLLRRLQFSLGGLLP